MTVSGFQVHPLLIGSLCGKEGHFPAYYGKKGRMFFVSVFPETSMLKSKWLFGGVNR